MAIETFRDPIFIKWYTDSSGQKITVQRINEQYKIVKNKIMLAEIPSEFEKIQITGFTELPYGRIPASATEFVCYSTLEGTTITIASYYSRGILMYPASRIFSSYDSASNTVLETIQDVADNLSGKGEYNPATTYYPRNIVSFGGGSYICIKKCIGISPANILYWQQVATPGLSLLYKGIYDSGITYNKQDFVNYDDSFYFCKVDGTVGILPTNTANWEVLVFPRSTVITLKNNVTLVSASTFVNIGIPEFSATTDDLTVIQNTTQIWEGVDYTISGTQINKISGTWEVGTIFYFKVMKNYIKSFFYTDGSLIQEGSINDSQLAGSIKIGSLNDLNTVDKSGVVNAINELKNDDILHLADNAKYAITVTNPPSPLLPLLLDGTDEIVKLQAMVDYLNTVGGGELLIPHTAPVAIGSTLIMPECPITIKGYGNYETSKGSRIKWIGGNNDSVIEINAYNSIKDIFIYNGNSATGVIGIDAKGVLAGRTPIHLVLDNVHVKSFDKGYSFSYSWYNEFRSVVASYCNVGYEIGIEVNNTDFYACHANVCGKGISLIAGSRQVLWSGCSFELNTDVAIDLGTGIFAYNWTIENPYFEGNRQTLKACGMFKMDNAFINGDWINTVDNTALACIEFIGASMCEITNTFFSPEIPANKAFAFGAGVTSPNSIVIGKVFPSLNWATALRDYPALIDLGVLNSQLSNIKIVMTDLYDANVANSKFFLPFGIGLEGNNAYTVSAYLITEEAITGSFTVKAGRNTTYDQIFNQTFASGVAAIGTQKLTLANELYFLYPVTYQNKIINTAASAGKFRVMFVLVN
jgi:hypothetical protein